MHQLSQTDIEYVVNLAHQAGVEILKIYETPFEIVDKSDNSPLTQADVASNKLLVDGLRALTPEIPVMSEELSEATYEERSSWTQFWCVDPLDGTKEFIKRTGEFTINIGLIENGIPKFGIVYAPVAGVMFAGGVHSSVGYARKVSQGKTQEIRVRELNYESIDIVASRDHAGPMVSALAKKYPNAGFKSMGSSLKFCLVASGEADIYLRDVPTMEWDTAAAHAILKAAGGELYTRDGNPLTYNKVSLRNPEIVALGSNIKHWDLDFGKD